MDPEHWASVKERDKVAHVTHRKPGKAGSFVCVYEPGREAPDINPNLIVESGLTHAVRLDGRRIPHPYHLRVRMRPAFRYICRWRLGRRPNGHLIRDLRAAGSGKTG